LNRYGYREESARIASGILQAARYFRYRLPEVFAGYERSRTLFPVEYPTACSPQAWATGAPLLFLRTMLGLEPRGNRLTVDAALPPEIEWLEVRGLPGRWGVVDAVGRRPTMPPMREAPGVGAHWRARDRLLSSGLRVDAELNTDDIDVARGEDVGRREGVGDARGEPEHRLDRFASVAGRMLFHF